MKIVYCDNWYWFKNEPNGRLSEGEAQRRFGSSGSRKLTVALIDEEVSAVPFATIVTMPGGNGIDTTRYTASGTPVLSLGYRRTDDRMFCFGGIEYRYPNPLESEERLMTEMSSVVSESYVFTPGGEATMRRRVGGAFYEFVLVKVSRTDRRIEMNWKPLLNFGDWQSFLPPTRDEFHAGLTVEEDQILQKSGGYTGRIG